MIPLIGDLEEPLLGVGRDRLDELCDSVDHLFHLAALYDMSAPAHRLEAANVRGTWHAVQLANSLRVGRVHHVSSIAAAGRYRGVFGEDMFEEATGLDDPYCRTKHASEKIVRAECRVPWRIYRPGVVVGHSQTGEMDKVDGPYYFFPILQRLAAALPSSVPLVGIDSGSELNLVPVDFVARALDYLAHSEGLDGHTFHLVDPEPKSTVDAINVFARAAGAPRVAAAVGGPLAPRRGNARRTIRRDAPGVAGALANSRFGIPPRLVRLVDSPRDSIAGTPELPWREAASRFRPSSPTPRCCGAIGRTSSMPTCATARRSPGGRSSGVDHRRVEGHRPRGRAQTRRGGCPRHAGRPLEGSARTHTDRIERSGGQAYVYPADLTQLEDCARSMRSSAPTARAKPPRSRS